MAFGKQFPGTGPDPLFSQLFVFGVSINFLPAALGGEVVEVGVLALIHLAVVYRVRMARGIAAKGRVDDLERFEQLRGQQRSPDTNLRCMESKWSWRSRCSCASAGLPQYLRMRMISTVRRRGLPARR